MWLQGTLRKKSRKKTHTVIRNILEKLQCFHI